MNTENINELKKRYEYKKFKIIEPVLDIGGGSGDFLLSQNVKDALIVDGYIPDKKIYNYLRADISKKLPELKKKFNTIFLTEVLEHLKNPLYLLAQVYDLLEDDGICYISIPYTEIGPNHHHVCRWTKKEIINQTKKLGFMPNVIQNRRRFSGLAFWLPHCWLVLSLRKIKINTNNKNIKTYKMKI